MSERIVCPHCHREFEPTAAMRERVEAEVRSQYEQQHAEALERARVDERAKHERDQAAVKRQLDEARKKLEAWTDEKADLLRRERDANERAAHAKVELEEKLALAAKAIREEEQLSAQRKFARDLDERVAEKDGVLRETQKKLDEARAKEVELQKEKLALDEKAARAEALAMERLAAERKRVEAEAVKRTEERLAREEAEREAEKAAEARTAIEQANARAEAERKARRDEQERVTALLREKQAIEDKAEQARVAAERQLIEAKREQHEKAQRDAQALVEKEREAARLKEQEHEQKLASMKAQMDELQQKLTQGSQQAQGEAQEVLLKEVLCGAFPRDEIADVGKGVQGADLIQTVRDDDGKPCGTIIWESKRTRAWSDTWLPKLRDDQRAKGAACAVVVTQAMPEGVEHFDLVDGVWVCEWRYATLLAGALRVGLVQTERARRSAEGRGHKADLVYRYVTSDEFRLQIEGVVEPLRDMEQDLAHEKAAMARLWKKRERQAARARENIVAIFGSFQGIAGRALPDLASLALPAGIAPTQQLALAAGGDDDGDEHDAADGDADERHAASAGPHDAQLVELLYRLLPADGQLGNKTAQERFAHAALVELGLTTHADDYERTKGLLLRAGRVRKGQGRGGAIGRVPVGSASGG